MKNKNCKESKRWIIKIGQQYLAHSRGGLVSDPKEAHGWHYKKDASAESVNWCDTGAVVSVMRRKDASVIV